MDSPWASASSLLPDVATCPGAGHSSLAGELWHPSAKPLRFPHAVLTGDWKPGSGVWVTTREAFWIALEALRAHKLRSFLTLLGVVIATTTLIVVMSIINGMNLYIADHIANLGANVFIVSQYQWAQGYEAWLKARRRNKPIRIEEFEFLKDNLRGYKNIGATADMWSDSNSARYQGHTLYNEDISGVTPSMIDIGQSEGRKRPLHHRIRLPA